MIRLILESVPGEIIEANFKAYLRSLDNQSDLSILSRLNFIAEVYLFKEECIFDVCVEIMSSQQESNLHS